MTGPLIWQLLHITKQRAPITSKWREKGTGRERLTLLLCSAISAGIFIVHLTCCTPGTYRGGIKVAKGEAWLEGPPRGWAVSWVTFLEDECVIQWEDMTGCLHGFLLMCLFCWQGAASNSGGVRWQRWFFSVNSMSPIIKRKRPWYRKFVKLVTLSGLWLVYHLKYIKKCLSFQCYPCF